MRRDARLPLVLLVLAAQRLLSALQSPDTRFVARWGGVTKDIAFAMVAHPASTDAFVVGGTYSHDFPVTAGRSVGDQQWCAFASALNASNGAARYSTVLCSAGGVWGRAAAAADDGALWVGGSVSGRRLPTSRDAFQPIYGGSRTAAGTGDGFVARWSATGEAGAYASYLGGNGDDNVTAMLPDGEGGVWLVGTTSSTNFPSRGSSGTRPLRGSSDGFVAHVSRQGQLLTSLLLGGTGWDAPMAMARVDANRLLIAGSTTSRDFDGAGEPLRAADGFVLSFDTRSLETEWFRRVGGPGDDRINAVIASPDEAVVLVGDTADACPSVAGDRDVWMVALSSTGQVTRQSCLGGESREEGNAAILIDQTVWVTGLTGSTSRRWTGSAGLATGFARAFVASVSLSTHRPISSFVVSPHIGHGKALAHGPTGTILAVGEIGDAGRRFLVPADTEMRPSPGAFSIGAEKGSTDPYLIGFIIPRR